MDNLIDELKSIVTVSNEHADFYNANMINKALDRISTLESQLKELKDQLEGSIALVDCDNPAGEYYAGLHCGVEDRDITDRYEAVDYGWDQAFEYIESCLPSPPITEKESYLPPKDWDELETEAMVSTAKNMKKGKYND